MDDLEHLAGELSNASWQEAQAAKPRLARVFERADFSQRQGAPALVEALAVVDDQQFELDLLTTALTHDPACDFLLVAWVSTQLRSGVLFAHDGPEAANDRLRLWLQVLQTIGGAPALETPEFAACLREARRVLEHGGTVNLTPS